MWVRLKAIRGKAYALSCSSKRARNSFRGQDPTLHLENYALHLYHDHLYMALGIYLNKITNRLLHLDLELLVLHLYLYMMLLLVLLSMLQDLLSMLLE